MGEKKKQRSENVQRRYKITVVNMLFKQKLQNERFENLMRQGFIKEIKNGQSESVHL